MTSYARGCPEPVQNLGGSPVERTAAGWYAAWIAIQRHGLPCAGSSSSSSRFAFCSTRRHWRGPCARAPSAAELRWVRRRRPGRWRRRGAPFAGRRDAARRSRRAGDDAVAAADRGCDAHPRGRATGRATIGAAYAARRRRPTSPLTDRTGQQPTPGAAPRGVRDPSLETPRAAGAAGPARAGERHDHDGPEPTYWWSPMVGGPTLRAVPQPDRQAAVLARATPPGERRRGRPRRTWRDPRRAAQPAAHASSLLRHVLEQPLGRDARPRASAARSGERHRPRQSAAAPGVASGPSGHAEPAGRWREAGLPCYGHRGRARRRRG